MNVCMSNRINHMAYEDHQIGGLACILKELRSDVHVMYKFVKKFKVSSLFNYIVQLRKAHSVKPTYDPLFE